jgi:hypothetical protein
MRKISDEHVKREAPDYFQCVAVDHFRVRCVLAEESDESFIKFDNCKASGFRKCSCHSADAGSDFQNVICRSDARCCDQFRELIGGYQEVLSKLRVRVGSHLAVILHYTGASSSAALSIAASS